MYKCLYVDLMDFESCSKRVELNATLITDQLKAFYKYEREGESSHVSSFHVLHCSCLQIVRLLRKIAAVNVEFITLINIRNHARKLLSRCTQQYIPNGKEICILWLTCSFHIFLFCYAIFLIVTKKLILKFRFLFY